MVNVRTESQHVVPYGKKWGVKAENGSRPSKVFSTKIMATAYAFDIAEKNNGKVVIHKKDGTFKSVRKTEESSKLLTMLNG